MIDPNTVKVVQDATAAMALSIEVMQQKAFASIRTPMKRTIRGFMLSQASDPVLAAACEPAQSKFGTPVQPLKKRRR